MAKAPRYDACSPASSAASHAKRCNRSKDTCAEVLLRKALWSRGIRYRLHARGLPGKPDILFPKERVAVFVDGDFWHGRNWGELETKLKCRANSDYWIAKIAYNRSRDLDQTAALRDLGWTVIRLWEKDITGDLDSAAQTVLKALGR